VNRGLIRYYSGEEMTNDGAKYKRIPLPFNKVIVDTDGCGEQYWGANNFYRITKFPSMNRGISLHHGIAIRGCFKGPWDGVGGACEGISNRAEKKKPPTRLVTTLDFKRECDRAFTAGEGGRRQSDKIVCLLLTDEMVAEHELKGTPDTVSGSMSHKSYFADGAEGNLCMRRRDCGCRQCCADMYEMCAYPDFTKSAKYQSEGAWATMTMTLKSEVGVALTKVSRSDDGLAVKERELVRNLKGGQTVAVFCGKNADSNGFGFWLGRVKAQPQGNVIFRLKRGFKCGHTMFKKQQVVKVCMGSLLLVVASGYLFLLLFDSASARHRGSDVDGCVCYHWKTQV
jgi:hypothetical protein